MPYITTGPCLSPPHDTHIQIKKYLCLRIDNELQSISQAYIFRQATLQAILLVPVLS